MPDENNDLVDKSDEQIEVTDQTSNSVDDIPELESSSKPRKFIGFINKHKIALSITFVIIIIAIISFVVIPIISVGETRLVNLNTTVRIEKDQTAKLKIRDVSVKVVNFTNDVCPAGQTCFGTDKKAVEYTLTENGKGYATGSETPAVGTQYKIETVSSDYKTYVDIKIVKSK